MESPLRGPDGASSLQLGPPLTVPVRARVSGACDGSEVKRLPAYVQLGASGVAMFSRLAIFGSLGEVCLPPLPGSVPGGASSAWSSRGREGV